MRVIRKTGLIPLGCLILLAACGRQAKNAGEGGGGESGAPPVVNVKVDSLITGVAEDALLATGRTDVLKKEKVASPVAGKLLAIKVAEGATVKPGEVVAVVRTRESESALEGAQALQREARSDAEKREAQHALELALATQSTLSLRAKQGGVVANRLVQEGEQIAESESLLTILDLSTLDFRAEVPIAGIGRILVGQEASITLQGLPGTAFPARVAAILPQVQSTSQSLPVRMRFTDPGAGKGESAGAVATRKLLKADMSGEARIILSRRADALLAPKPALLRNDETGEYTLAIVGEDSVAHILKVKPGAAQGDRVEVSGEGLHPGLKVVVQGQYGLADSTRVMPVP
ncbi:MAG: heavy metal efflux rane fusion protein CzcB family protein [Fibrobacteres bacterium]|nr:heavy metal efflux rane fusion protein CzcB family protein [Fibrobacterota bacterium]